MEKDPCLAAATRRSGGSQRRLRALLRTVSAIPVPLAASDDRRLPLKKVLVANRGEIATRICRAARELGLASVAVFAEQDAQSLHTRAADEAVALPAHASGGALAPYLDVEAVLAAAKKAGADCLHPGYGFLSEVPELPRRCAEEGLVWIGPPAAAVELFGDKAKARQLAAQLGVPIVRGSPGTLPDAAAVKAFLAAEGIPFPVMLKAVAGGGGRGMREVRSAEDLDAAFTSAVREAEAAFGNGALLVEQLWDDPKHIEVQVLCDAHGSAIHLFERDCSIQRQRQKVIEVAPAPGMPPGLRERLCADALKLVKAAGYVNAGTVEFLISTGGGLLSDDSQYAFIECNPRIQVEHCVTEEVTGVDLVQSQILVSAGRSLASLGLDQGSLRVQGYSIQSRLTLAPSRSSLVTVYREPTGAGVRVESNLYSGYRVPYDYDPLLAKLICTVRAPGRAAEDLETFRAAVVRSLRAVSELQVGGLATNQAALLRLLQSGPLQAGTMTTSLVAKVDQGAAPAVESGARGVISSNMSWEGSSARPVAERARELLDSGLKELGAAAGELGSAASAGPVAPGAVTVPMDALLVELRVNEGQFVKAGSIVAVVSAMKMEQSLAAPFDGVIKEVGGYANGSRVPAGAVLAVLAEADKAAIEIATKSGSNAREPDWYDNPPSSGGGSIVEMNRIKELALGMGGKDNLLRQSSQGKLNVRERIEALLDKGTFDEIGSMAGFPRYERDGSVREFQPTNCVGGSGMINGLLTVVTGDDFSIRGGHADGGSVMKQNYLERMCRELRCPIVRLLDGSSGGGSLVSTVGKDAAGGKQKTGSSEAQAKPQDNFKGTLKDGATYLAKNPSFDIIAEMLNEVPQVALLGGPTVGLASARAVMTHFSVMIRGLSQLFVAGPPVVEGTGQAPVTKEELGGVGVHGANGSVDNVVGSEQEALEHIARFLSYLPPSCWELPPIQERWEEPAGAEELISIIPTQRQRSYDIRAIIARIVDDGSFFEMGETWGRDQVTGFARMEGRPIAIFAQDCKFDGGGMSANGGRKIARHVELVNTFHLPVLSLVDSPGFVVGVASERASTIRFGGQAIGQLSASKVPWFTVVIRRVFGVAGAALASRKTDDTRVAWPSADWGSLPPEGGIQAGFKRTLANHPDPQSVIRQVLDKYNSTRSPLRTAASFGVEEIIDPRHTRAYVAKWIKNAYRILSHPDRLGPKPGGYHIF